MQYIREKVVKSVLASEQPSSNTIGESGTSGGGSSQIPSVELMALQRKLRADIITKKLQKVQDARKVARREGSGGVHSEGVRLHPADQFYRSRKQNKREWKLLEKDLKKKKSEKDEARK